MKVENIRLCHSPLTDSIFAGSLSEDGVTWTQKKDVTNDFITAAIGRWAGFKEVITASDGSKYEFTCKKLENDLES